MKKKDPKKSTVLPEKFTNISKQATGDGRVFRSSDVPRGDANPKDSQDPLPPKKSKKK